MNNDNFAFRVLTVTILTNFLTSDVALVQMV